MISILERLFEQASSRQRLLGLWAALGVTLQLSLPALNGVSAVGPLALWMWWLPLAALGLDLLLMSANEQAGGALTTTRRRPRRSQAMRVQSARSGAAVPGLSSRATRPPRGLSVTSYSTPSRIGR